MRSLILMITFLTRIPIKYPYEYKDEDFIKGIILMPIVGVIIGLLLWGISFSGIFLDKPVTILFIWLFYIWITGGLHIDGLADTVDGIFSNRDRQRVFEIMKDSRIGTFGVIAIISIIISNLILMNYLDYKAIILMPIAGRSCALLACSTSKYAREQGMGKGFIDNAGLKEGIFSVVVFALVGIITYSYFILPIVMICIIFTIYITNYIKKKLGGMTGDTIGFMIEINQTFFLLTIYILKGLII